MNLERKITHQNYFPYKKKKNKFWSGLLEKEISKQPEAILKNSIVKSKSHISFLIENQIKLRIHPKITPVFGAVVSLVIVLLLLSPWIEFNTNDEIEVFVFILCCLLTIFFIVYYFTMPKKEVIFDRANGTITFPGFMWSQNYTMPFPEVTLAYFGGSRTPTMNLIVVCPDRFGTGSEIGLGKELFNDLSFLVWYMDKNRPLPPGDAFDEFRNQDFERRKIEDFPPPLFISHIETPEASTNEQQERDKYWQEQLTQGNDGVMNWVLWQSEINILKHGKK